VKYCVLELGLNAMEWGNRWDRGKTVGLVFTIRPVRFCVRISDEGRGFDVARVREAVRRQGPERSFRGYGIRVCSEFADELRYNSRGNAVTLVKNIWQPR
jgi:anti-sigma regulatory factor (Ser/Thr protein kinase)